MDSLKKQQDHYQYYISEAAEAAAQHEAEIVDDADVLRMYLEEAIEKHDDHIAVIYVTKMLKLAKFSSDHIDIAKILRKHSGLQDYFSITECIQKAKDSAKVPGDWQEIEQFLTDY